ncbi:Asp23/Gls24 family envelope stress response protein [Enterococcus sp. BWR-S5]|uniref:Asp23/Gls24 family envelope stress response protein n=1 Tax=Enterococcus sp. BWR-S5 TaxID=2787714 RepID=UPI001923EA2D|nr:Asp23/Gls24 family envelope stress response protein [Enterococcus sp. BWR-S5]MBL1223501.1 Asp23/Gls24 family envelope stress response protein [Enterococcus sp. BWR-S5]
MDTTKPVTTPNAPVQEVKGELTYDDKVIQKIIGIALENIDGLLTVDGGFFSNIAEKLVNTDNVTSGIDVEVGKKQVAVDLDIVAEYGKDIAKLFTDIQKLIVEEVKKMTSLEVIEVNVNVVDIKTREQYEKDSVTVQDRVGNVAESTGEFASNQTDKAKKALNKGADKAKEQMEPRVQ